LQPDAARNTPLLVPGNSGPSIDFTNEFKGDQTYLFHCHKLEHEDQGMMVNHRATAV